MQKLLWKDSVSSERGSGNRGSYSIEGAFSITIFTICLLAALSALTVIRIELEVQDAINQTALELSQYAYGLGKVVPIFGEENEEAEVAGTLQNIFMEKAREKMASGIGAPFAKELTKKHFSRTEWEAWLIKQGVAEGYASFDFSGTDILGDGKTIVISVSYEIEIKTYGLIKIKIPIHQKAVTYALLPENADWLEWLRRKEAEETEKDSIWKKSNFLRGQYFIRQLKAEHPNTAVKSGYGIDLYDQKNGCYTEAFSLNLFSATYADCNGEKTEAGSYFVREEALQKQITGYAARLEEDIKKGKQTLPMESGEEQKKVAAQKKVLLLILPEEGKENQSMQDALLKIQKQLAGKGIFLELQYREEALL